MLELYLGGGLAASEDGSIAIFAGSTLGGGTVVNYMNCIRTPDRSAASGRRWGSTGSTAADYDRHIDAIWERLSVNDTATSQNRTHKKLLAGCEELGYPHRPLTRNADASCDDPRVCGYCFAGCQKGCKQSTMKTFLQDAADAGARFVVGRPRRPDPRRGRPRGRGRGDRHARRRLDDGADRSRGHRSWSPAARSSRRRCCCARGSAARRSASICGCIRPAVVSGVYEEPIEGWIGQIQSALSDQFTQCEGDHGFLIEAISVAPGAAGVVVPVGRRAESQASGWRATLRYSAPFVSVARDHGEGEVVIDDYGRAVTRWSLRRRGRRADVPAGDGRAGQAPTGRRREGDRDLVPAPIDLARRRGLRCVRRRDRGRLAGGRTTSRCSPPIRWGRAGWAPTPPTRSPTVAASSTTSQGVWIGDGSRVPDRARRQPDDLDHVARASDGREHRDRLRSGRGPAGTGTR